MYHIHQIFWSCVHEASISAPYYSMSHVDFEVHKLVDKKGQKIKRCYLAKNIL